MAKTTVGELVYQITGDVDNLKAAVKQAEGEISKLKKQFSDADKSIGKTNDAVGFLKKGITALAGAFAVGTIVSFFKSAAEAAENVIAVQTRLAQTVRVATDASDEQIQSLFRQAEELDKVGVVGKEAILTAQGQLAAFDLTAGSIEKLTPAMLNLIVAENGLNASSESAKGIANGLGKALQGQFDTLTKQGFRFDDATKKMLAFGTESERVEALVSILDSTYKDLNITMGESSPGQILRAKNAFNDLKEDIGFALVPTINFLAREIIGMGNEVTGNADRINQWGKVIFQITQGIIIAAKIVRGMITLLAAFADMTIQVAKVQFNFAKDIVNNFKNVGQIGSQVFAALKQGIKGDFGGAMDTLKQTVKSTFTNTTAALEQTKNFSAGWIEELGQQADSFGQTINSMKTGYQGLSKEAISAYKGIQREESNYADTSKDKSRATADDIGRLKDRFEELGQKGSDALVELEEAFKNKIDSINNKIAELKQSLTDLTEQFNENIASENKGIAERIVAEQRAIADLRNQLFEAQSDSSPNSKRISELQTEIREREKGLKSQRDLEIQYADEIKEAKRRASLTDFQRDIEDFLAKKERLRIEFEEKKADLEAKLLLEEENKAKTVELYELKHAEINEIIRVANERFQAFSNERIDITKKEVNAQIQYYNQLAQAIARAKSAQTSALLQSGNKPQFAVGGFVDGRGGEVHPGEYVVPAHLVQKFGGVISALESARTGNINNSKTVNAPINIQANVDGNADWAAIARELQWELNRR